MKRNKLKIVILLTIILIPVIAIAFVHNNGIKNIILDNYVDNIEINQNSNQDNYVSDEVIKNIPSTEIPALTENEEKNVETEKVEDEKFQEQGQIVFESGEDNFSQFQLGVKRGLTYYSQIDSRWKNESYTSIGDYSQTIGSSGCGPTSAAIVITSIKGTITPSEMGNLYVERGYRSANSGTYFSAFRWTADYFGISDFQETYSFDDAIDLLKNNHYVIASCGSGLFTYGGHYIVLYSLEGDTIKIYDPYLYAGKFDVSSRRGKVSVSGDTVYCSINNFKNYANYSKFFAFGYDANDLINPINNVVKTQTYTKYVVAKSGLRVRDAENGNVVDLLNYGTAVTIFETSGNWARIGDNRWVSLDYLQYSISSNGSYVNKTNQYNVKVTAKSGLRVRTGPSTGYSVKKIYPYGTVATIYEEKNGFGRTPSGWIYLKYTTKNNENAQNSNYILGRYKVTSAQKLNVRSGASTNYSIKKQYTNGTVFDTYQITNNWAKTPSGWVCLDYCALLYKY